MVTCDTHCHASLAWYAPVESLLYEMDANGVERALLIQIGGQFDNSYQQECVRRYPGRFASVVIVDTTRADAPEALARWAERGAAGIRLGPDTRSPGDDPLAIWRAAARLGLPVSCQGSAEALAADSFAQLVQELPALPIVLEHLAGLDRVNVRGRTREQPSGGQSTGAHDAAGARAKVLALARFPNVSVKVHGLGEFCVRAMPVAEPFPFVRPISPLLDDLYQAFGPDRLMWGSDYPPVAAREGYRLALRLVMDEYASKDARAREAIFGGTAARVFPIRP